MNEHWLSDRIMRSQAVTREGLTESQVIAVLRGLADYTLWQRAFYDQSLSGPAKTAATFCHSIADSIEDMIRDPDHRHKWRGVMDGSVYCELCRKSMWADEVDDE